MLLTTLLLSVVHAARTTKQYERSTPQNSSTAAAAVVISDVSGALLAMVCRPVCANMLCVWVCVVATRLRRRWKIHEEYEPNVRNRSHLNVVSAVCVCCFVVVYCMGNGRRLPVESCRVRRWDSAR